MYIFALLAKVDPSSPDKEESDGGPGSESSTFGSSSVPLGVDSARLGLLKFSRFSTSSQLEVALLDSTHSFV